MFDFGIPEFLVIAITVAFVLGPKRVAEVMRRAGLLYRRARALLNRFAGEAQRAYREDMPEAQEVPVQPANRLPISATGQREARAGTPPQLVGAAGAPSPLPSRPHPAEAWLTRLASSVDGSAEKGRRAKEG